MQLEETTIRKSKLEIFKLEISLELLQSPKSEVQVGGPERLEPVRQNSYED